MLEKKIRKLGLKNDIEYVVFFLKLVPQIF